MNGIINNFVNNQSHASHSSGVFLFFTSLCFFFLFLHNLTFIGIVKIRTNNLYIYIVYSNVVISQDICTYLTCLASSISYSNGKSQSSI